MLCLTKESCEQLAAPKTHQEPIRISSATDKMPDQYSTLSPLKAGGKKYK